ncbi:hypothetical protein MLD38_017690 [Melastoma candidum]|uniref:Uncharacterized protein n=1 Tax=Melastoma candidum TaxID=119954 RepID=A0ACB9QRI5_9MYRT|nr:hypothetical protein MLD38_017690 [Melastoma candidum]
MPSCMENFVRGAARARKPLNIAAGSVCREASKSGAGQADRLNIPSLYPSPSPSPPLSLLPTTAPPLPSPPLPPFFMTLPSRSMPSLRLNSGRTGSAAPAECGHSFHFTCIASHVRGKGGLVCPVCDATWKDVPLLGGIRRKDEDSCDVEDKKMVEITPSPPMVKPAKSCPEPCSLHLTNPRLYGDDEPLVLPKTCRVRFAVIPEPYEDTGQRGDDGNDEEFR